MFTHKYRAGFIHGWTDRDACRAQLGTVTLGTFRTYRAAQVAITKAMRRALFA